jgi:lactoylglutathione lyase
MAYRLTSTRLLVIDFAACFRFYRDVLGFRPVFGTEHDSFADFDTGEARLSLFDRHEMCEALGTSPRPGADLAPDPVCLVLAVEDVDAAWGHVDRLGARLVAAPADHPEWGLRTAHVRDPDGNLIELNQTLAAA